MDSGSLECQPYSTCGSPGRVTTSRSISSIEISTERVAVGQVPAGRRMQ
jgi:hypothetical protein